MTTLEKSTSMKTKISSSSPKSKNYNYKTPSSNKEPNNSKRNKSKKLLLLEPNQSTTNKPKNVSKNFKCKSTPYSMTKTKSSVKKSHFKNTSKKKSI